MITSRSRQRGTASIEFGLVFLLFLTFVFSLIEYARVMFLWNAVQEVSRRAARAAAVTDFSDSAAMDALRQRALLRGGPGALPLAPDIGSAQIRIEYLWMDAAGALQVLPQLPACPLANRINCARDPQGASCIRFVRVRLCGPGASCAPLAVAPLAPWSLAPTTLPLATTVAPAESLGYTPGQAPCP
ncbi:MAG: pilus assembly protein TadE [Pseudoduganella sp.]|nr:pilus assembly protein TadE [Pseudoduganella sp.]